MFMKDIYFQNNFQNHLFPFFFYFQKGFEERVSRLEGLFGAGIYFTENSSKADEYTTPDEKELCYLFLSRVCLGNPYVTEQPMNGTRRPPPISGTNNSQ